MTDKVRSEQVGDKIVPVLIWPDGTWIHLMPHRIDGGQDPSDTLRRWIDAWLADRRDWRIGLSVKPKYRDDPLLYEQGEIIAVYPSGFGGVLDENGVLKIRLQSGTVVLRASDQWVTA